MRSWAAEDADQVLLATDPDREGKLSPGTVRDPEEQEVTQEPAGQARRVLRNHRIRGQGRRFAPAQHLHAAREHAGPPRLTTWSGSTSPLLWKKIGPSRPLARADPALRLLVEREQEIESFKTQEYWTVHLESHKGKDKFSARLTQYKGDKVEHHHHYRRAAASRSDRAAKTAKGRGTVVGGGAKLRHHRRLHHLHVAAGSGAQARHDRATPCAQRKSSTKAWTLAAGAWA
jgi:DNA topoisomerase-1